MEPVVPLIGPVRHKFVLFGSSIVQLSFSEEGWGAILAHKYARKADIILRGYGGWNSRRALQVLHQVFPKDSATQPSLVIVYFGGNDSVAHVPGWDGPHVPLEEYVTNMKTIATHIQGLSNTTRMIFLSTPPVNEYQIRDLSGDYALLRNNQLGKKYSDALIKLGKEMNFTVIDLFDTFYKNPGWWRTAFTDGIHFTADGSEIVAAEILKVLKAADWKPHLHYESIPTEFEESSRSTVDVLELNLLKLNNERIQSRKARRRSAL